MPESVEKRGFACLNCDTRGQFAEPDRRARSPGRFAGPVRQASSNDLQRSDRNCRAKPVRLAALKPATLRNTGSMTKGHTPADPPRDIDFSQQDFNRVRALIYQLAGISLNDSKQQMVYSRLSRRLRVRGVAGFRAYLDDIESGRDPGETTEFINALTTNLTSFFREAYHFPILAEHLKSCGQTVRIWCSAASTGEEPYSLAMTAVEALGGFSDRIRIQASDIDTHVLAQADAGIYPRERIAKLSPERLRRFFLSGKGASEGYVRVRPELRQLIEFTQLNLLGREWPVHGPFDAIFCRNVMIYFDKPTQATILKRMVPMLQPDGLLFAGHSENFQYVCPDLISRGQTVYALTKGRNTQARPMHRSAA